MINYFYQQRITSFSAGILIVFCVMLFRNGLLVQKKQNLVDFSVLIEQTLESEHLRVKYTDFERTFSLTAETKKFYKLSDYKLAWLTGEKPLYHTDSLILALENASIEGLDSNDYYLSEIKQLKQETFNDTVTVFNNEKIHKLDILLTDAYLHYANHLYSGRIDPGVLDTSWISNPKTKDFSLYLHAALQENIVKKSLSDLCPKEIQYNETKKKLSYYQKLEQKGGWKPFVVDSVLKLEKGSFDSTVYFIKKHLIWTNDLFSDEPDGFYDEKLSRAISHFQLRYGLMVNGKLDRATLERLNISVSSLIKQLSLNIERYRWLPERLGKKHIIVNIPGYDLNVFENGTCKVMDMRVIVGQYRTQTPIFSDTLENLIFSPEWSVPLSIARKELLPMLKVDPEKLEDQGFRLYEDWGYKSKPVSMWEIDWEDVKPKNFRYRLVAESGKNNPLGYVMFNFPNKMDIYLHDTPYDYLFQFQKRDLSHGCIRVEYPAHLAGYILNTDSSWNRNRIIEQMSQYSPVRVKISNKMPVHLVYFTNWVDEENQLHSADDIYRYDEKQWKAIEKTHRQVTTKGYLVKSK